MIVNVRLDGSVTAPFLVDTGATDVLIPASLAKRLGIQAGPETRTQELPAPRTGSSRTRP